MESAYDIDELEVDEESCIEAQVKVLDHFGYSSGTCITRPSDIQACKLAWAMKDYDCRAIVYSFSMLTCKGCNVETYGEERYFRSNLGY